MIERTWRCSRRVFLGKLLMVGSASGLALAAATPAVAAPVNIDISGTILSGYDGSGLFGSARGELAGLSYTTHYLFDPTLGLRTTQDDWDTVLGGPRSWSPNSSAYFADPALAATLTINGHTVGIGTNLEGDFHAGSGAYWASTGGNLNGQTYSALAESVFGSAFATRLETAFSASNFTFSQGSFLVGSSYGALKPQTIAVGSVGAIAAVPEPVTWAMMLLGFGAIGGSLRYRRRTSSVSYA